MENRDFRARLKNHSREVNPTAWGQMESLLDSLPKAKKDEDKKKRGFWLFFFGLGFIALLTATWMFLGSGDNTEMDSTLSTNVNNNESTTDDNELAILDSNSKTRIEEEVPFSKSKKYQKSNDFDENEIYRAESERKMNNNENLNAIRQNQQNESSGSNDSGLNRKGEIIDIDNKIKEEKNIEEIKHNENFNPNTSGESSRVIGDFTTNYLNSVITKGDEIIENEGNTAVVDNVDFVDERNPNYEKNEIVNSNSIVDSRPSLLPLNRLILPMNEIVIRGRRSIPTTPGVKIFKPSSFSVFASSGYAWFNENPGFILQGGISYDVDRIMELEANIGYAYGSEQNIPAGELFTFERQFDLSFLLHFNAIKNGTHKLSFIAGIGYSIYSGQRIIMSNPIGINERSSSGRNLQGAINYQARINKKYALGLRIGLISYDDSVLYIAPRFIFFL